jgi:hypothetical protein
MRANKKHAKGKEKSRIKIEIYCPNNKSFVDATMSSKKRHISNQFLYLIQFVANRWVSVGSCVELAEFGAFRISKLWLFMKL